jgi:uncharacterized repeat protein (TIGR01451 family)
MELVMGSTAIRKGFTNNQFIITASNKGRQTANNVSIRWKAPAGILPGTPSLPFSSVATATEDGKNIKTYSWTIPAIAPFASTTVQLLHGNDASVVIGDTIKMSGWIDGMTADCGNAATPLEQTYRAVGAIDPNDMQVAPLGYGNEGYIMPSQVLTYTVRFQNMGNHPATDVTIEDVLPEGLDLETFKVVSQSHENLSMHMQGRKITFRHEGIYLVDSASNPEGSQGYIMFSVAPLQGIKAGTVLRNKASIQFDHYEPIETNEVINTIQSARQEQQMIVVKSWPNPAMDVIYLNLEHRMGKFTERQIRQVDFIDLNGRRILTKTFGPADELRVDIPVLLNGFYMLKLTDTKGVTYTHKTYIRKTR